MPTYEYRCPSCGHEFERFERKITNKRTEKCPSCGARVTRTISGGAGFVLKGSGFYATDYKRAPEKKDGAEAQAESQPDAKAESKSGDKAPEKTGKPEKNESAAASKKSKASGADS